jgi:hypothetical protein
MAQHTFTIIDNQITFAGKNETSFVKISGKINAKIPRTGVRHGTYNYVFERSLKNFLSEKEDFYNNVRENLQLTRDDNILLRVYKPLAPGRPVPEPFDALLAEAKNTLRMSFLGLTTPVGVMKYNGKFLYIMPPGFRPLSDLGVVSTRLIENTWTFMEEVASEGILLFDNKLENLIVGADDKVCAIDFGACFFLGDVCTKEAPNCVLLLNALVMVVNIQSSNQAWRKKSQFFLQKVQQAWYNLKQKQECNVCNFISSIVGKSYTSFVGRLDTALLYNRKGVATAKHFPDDLSVLFGRNEEGIMKTQEFYMFMLYHYADSILKEKLVGMRHFQLEDVTACVLDHLWSQLTGDSQRSPERMHSLQRAACAKE